MFVYRLYVIEFISYSITCLYTGCMLLSLLVTVSHVCIQAGLSRRSQSSKLAPPSMSIQPLPPLQEDAEESSRPILKHSTASESSMLRASLRRKDFPPLAPPPDFAPTPPPATKPSSVSSPQLTRRPSAGNITTQPPAPPIPATQPPPAGHPFSSAPPPPPPPPGPPDGAPPPPAPPPPPVVPPQTKSLSEMVQQHKLKTRQQQEQTGVSDSVGDELLWLPLYQLDHYRKAL